MPTLEIMSCLHCASKAEIVCEPIGPDDHYVVG